MTKYDLHLLDTLSCELASVINNISVPLTSAIGRDLLSMKAKIDNHIIREEANNLGPTK